jgi:plasmid stabilization system protein ParE
MKYTVVWKSAAKRQLAEIWMRAADRKAITTAADAIDAILRRWPHTCGESRGSKFRLVIEGPLAAFYAVSEEDRLVTVSYIRDLSRHS